MWIATWRFEAKQVHFHLNACATLGALEEEIYIHDDIVSSRFEWVLHL